ncbi:hypothetical protein GE061_003374 [Apolygus lucorum]|uniref:SCP domain-containing protein n=1 Tax=Apolygus lucorum TaxID=248454 RepID=A0A8S9X4F6_APOLU|nr:hypothetical protein GE061_003374 [Apolygus lucorum]
MGEVPGWPPAGNMRLLTYDKTLEDIAYRWAVQCMEGHDKCRKTEEWWSVGQNIAREYGGKQMLKTNPEGDVAAWFDEFRNADPKMIDGFFVKVNKDKRPTGHFLQLVWANTEKVGCAMISYKKMNTYSFYPFVRVTVCNYGPTGNVISYPVYSPVDPCPMNTKCVWDFKPSIIEKCNETNLGDLEYSDSTNPDSTYETSRDFSSKPGGRRAENLLFAHEEKNSSNIVVPGQLLYTYPPQLPQKSSLEHQHLGRYWDGEFVHATDAFQNMITPSSFSLLRTNKYRSNHCSMYHKDFQPSFVIAYEQPAAQFMSDLPRARFGTILQAHPGEEDFVATEDEFQDIFFSGAGQAEDLGLLSDVILKIRKNLFIESTEIDEEHQVPAEYDALDKLELEHEITGVHHHLVATTSSDVSEEQYKDLLVVTAEGKPTAALSTPRNEMPRMREATGENNDSLTLPSVTLLILNCLALWNKLSF